MKYWTLFFRREVTRDETPTLFGERECGSQSSEIRLEAEDQWNAAVVATSNTLAEIPDSPRATARVFLMPLPIQKMRVAVLGLVLHGYTMNHHGSIVEMVRHG